jgi:glycosyltransferase 2 family protein
MESRLRLRNGLIVFTRWVCAGILLYGAGRQIVVELRKLHGREINLDLTLLFVGALLYTAAMSCFAAYWRQAAISVGGRPGSLEVQRAYFASQLGKYIPGKAWVILIRCALALVALLAAGNARPVMLALATGLTAGLVFAVLPPVFGRLATWTARSFQKADSIPIATITYATWFQAFRYCIPGWMGVGLSLVSIAGSLGISMFSFAGFLLACGGIALAIVGGFAVLIVPAGLGVREWVMMQTLGPSVGISNAALIAILARITHVSAELFVAGCLYLLGKRRNQK